MRNADPPTIQQDTAIPLSKEAEHKIREVHSHDGKTLPDPPPLQWDRQCQGWTGEAAGRRWVLVELRAWRSVLRALTDARLERAQR